MPLRNPSGFSFNPQLHSSPSPRRWGEASCRVCWCSAGCSAQGITELSYGFITPFLWPCRKVQENAFCKSGLFCTSGCLLVKLYCNRSSLGRCMCPQPSHPDRQSSISVSAAPSLCRERNWQRQFHSLSRDCRLLLGRGLVLLSKQKGPQHLLGNVVVSLVLCRIN